MLNLCRQRKSIIFEEIKKNTLIKKLVGSILPKPLKQNIARIFFRVRKLIVYDQYDSTAYWKSRATSETQASVLWQNQEYNDIYRKKQKEIIKSFLHNMPQNLRVLDIGCGIGVVSKMILELRPDAKIDAVDFEEMIAIASKVNANDSINYISSSAEEYAAKAETYDFIISSGCYSAIRDIRKLEKSMLQGAEMLKKSGVLLLIDPFHRWSYLARAKYGTKDVVNLLSKKKLKLFHKSGVLFWPYREKLANSKLTGDKLLTLFNKGERRLHKWGAHFWADYKVLAFKF